MPPASTTSDVIDETQKQVDENYLGNYPRLVTLKNQCDPLNLFRLNANVKPRRVDECGARLVAATAQLTGPRRMVCA